MAIAVALSTSACRTAEHKSESESMSGEGVAAATDPIADRSEGYTRRIYDSLVASGAAQATFAGGCFWCVEGAFDVVPGVLATVSGYIGGSDKDPTYNEVSAGGTGHAEAVSILYDPKRVSYAQLLDVFWHNIDPLTANRQFCDAGSQYRAAIFYYGEEQRRAADSSKQALAASGRFDKPIVTEISAATKFTPAEEYHQDFYLKKPDHYRAYREGCRRDQRLKELWGEAGH